MPDKLKNILVATCLIFGTSFTSAQQVLWEKKYPITDQEKSWMQSIDFTLDNHIIALATDTNATLIKYTMDGDTVWTYRYPDSTNANYKNRVKTISDGYITAVTLRKDVTHTQLYKFDKEGNVKWYDTYYNGRNNTFPQSLYVDNDTTYYVFSFSNNPQGGGGGTINGPLYYVHSIDSSSTENWGSLYYKCLTAAIDVSTIAKYAPDRFMLYGGGHVPVWKSPLWSSCEATGTP